MTIALTPIQQHLAREAAQVLLTELATADFSDPASDQQTIRRHAYLRGKLDVYTELLEFSNPDKQPKD
jgi:hypothetical protein